MNPLSVSQLKPLSYYIIFALVSYVFKSISNVLAHDPGDVQSILETGHYGDALPVYDNAVKNDPKNYLNYFKRATVYLALNRPKPAFEDLNTALELNKDFTPALKQRAHLHIKVGNLDDAHIDFERLIKLGKDIQEADLQIRNIERLRDMVMNVQDLIEDHQHDVALVSLNELVEQIPLSKEFLKMRADAFEKVGEIRRAIHDYRTIAKLSVDAATYLTIARMYYKLGEIEESLNNVRECLKLDPDHNACMELYKPTKKLNNHIQSMLTSKKSSSDSDTCVSQGKSALKILEKSRVSSQLALIYSIQSVMCHCLSRASDTSGEGLKICDDAIENSRDGGIEGIAIEKSDLLCDKADLLAENGDYVQALQAFQQSHKLKQTRRSSEGIERMSRAQKQKKKRDYYKILGVRRNADTNEISKAYRKLAAKWHPDRHQTEEAKKSAQAKFMDIADAKAVLSDPKKRKQYDRGEDPLDPESKQSSQQHGFYGDPFSHFGSGGSPFTFKFNFG